MENLGILSCTTWGSRQVWLRAHIKQKFQRCLRDSERRDEIACRPCVLLRVSGYQKQVGATRCHNGLRCRRSVQDEKCHLTCDHRRSLRFHRSPVTFGYSLDTAQDFSHPRAGGPLLQSFFTCAIASRRRLKQSNLLQHNKSLQGTSLLQVSAVPNVWRRWVFKRDRWGQ